MSDQHLNPGEPQEKKSLNRAERRAEKHRETIQSFSFQNESQCRTGYVESGERSATDVCFLAVFMISVLAMIGLSAYGYTNGNAKLLFAPTDASGNTCGNPMNSTFKDYQFLYFTDLNASNFLATAVCVTECPKVDNADLSCRTNTKVKQCGKAEYAAEPVGFICVPQDLGDVKEKFQKQYEQAINRANQNEGFRDISKASNALLTSIGVGLVYTILFMYLMAYCAPLISYIGIGVIELAHVAAIGGLLMEAQKNSYTAQTNYIAAGCIALSLLIFNCLLCCFWSKVQLAIAIIDATADFMVATKRLAFVSMTYFFITIMYMLFWGVAAVGVIAMNEIEVQPDNGTKRIIWQTPQQIMIGFMFFGLVWLLVFMTDKVRFITMSSASQYYWSSDRKNNGTASVCSAGYQASIKHAGSLALGSLIHALVIILKMLIEAASKENKSNNAGAAIVFCLLKCCVNCIEDFVEHLNTCAYAMMSISGDSYCTSAWNGFILNLKHCVKFYFATNLASAFVFIGMVTVVAANMGTTWLLMMYVFPECKEVSSFMTPLTVTAVITFFIVLVFLGPFDEAVTATLMCLAVDLELNGEPKHGPPSYHDKIDAMFEEEGGHKAVAHAADPEIDINASYGQHQTHGQYYNQTGAPAHNGNNMY